MQEFSVVLVEHCGLGMPYCHFTLSLFLCLRGRKNKTLAAANIIKLLALSGDRLRRSHWTMTLKINECAALEDKYLLIFHSIIFGRAPERQQLQRFWVYLIRKEKYCIVTFTDSSSKQESLVEFLWSQIHAAF